MSLPGSFHLGANNILILILRRNDKLGRAFSPDVRKMCTRDGFLLGKNTKKISKCVKFKTKLTHFEENFKARYEGTSTFFLVSRHLTHLRRCNRGLSYMQNTGNTSTNCLLSEVLLYFFLFTLFLFFLYNIKWKPTSVYRIDNNVADISNRCQSSGYSPLTLRSYQNISAMNLIYSLYIEKDTFWYSTFHNNV